MKRSRINPIGKIGRSNKIARDSIASQASELGLDSCEVGFPGCTGTFGLAPAHKHPREWYRRFPELLSEFKQWIAACQWCHRILDDRSKTTKVESDAIFDRLRP